MYTKNVLLMNIFLQTHILNNLLVFRDESVLLVILSSVMIFTHIYIFPWDVCLALNCSIWKHVVNQYSKREKGFGLGYPQNYTLHELHVSTNYLFIYFYSFEEVSILEYKKHSSGPHSTCGLSDLRRAWVLWMFCTWINKHFWAMSCKRTRLLLIQSGHLD